MCGIGGFQLKDPGAASGALSWLNAVNAIQRARGPDDSGIWTDKSNHTGLCHTRLAILDLSPDGHQPMVTTDAALAALTIVFNGEIYNWQKLKTTLEAEGVQFRSHSDTEILLHLYQRHGAGMLDMLRGMFAIAIFDERDGSLFCARDRVGKKPFIYSQTQEGVAFASSIPALRAFPGVSSELNHGALAAILVHNMRHVPDPHTAFSHIHRLQPGHAMVIRNGVIAKIWRWWTPVAAAGVITPQRVRETLEEAVRLRMVADVPVGALLSGGVDSTAIVHLMTKLGHGAVKTYALGMDAEDEDLRRARVMAQALGCEHQEFYFDPERQWQVFQDILATYGEPIMLLPLIHTHELCRSIRDDGLRVVLAGHGADELFCGYTGHVRTAQFSRLLPWLSAPAKALSFLPRAWQHEAICVAAAKRGQRKAALYHSREDEAWSGILTPQSRATMVNLAADAMAYWGGLTPSNSYLEESNFAGLMVENTHSVITAGDLPPMMASVEMRAPFLDQEMIALALATSAKDKVPGKDPSRLKYILKLAVANLMPPELLYAAKRGFGMGIPERDLMLGPWRSHIDQCFEHAQSTDGLFDVEGIRGQWKSMKDGGAVRVDRLARVFSVQYWLQCDHQNTGKLPS